MKIIVPTAEMIKPFLGSQKRKENTEYRLLTFCVQQTVPEGVLIYNVLTKSLILLEGEEVEQLTHLDVLINDWFLVPIDNDDKKLADQLSEILRLVVKPSKGITSYTIFTTTDCNARCFYCYEKGYPRDNMSDETAEKVVQFIKEHHEDKKVKIQWFGGEPLYNARVIDVICSGLQTENIEYRSTMISNGYLFDDELIQKAVELWKLKSVQITLDGTEEVYNRSKAYIYNDSNAYQRVTQNIGKLLDAHIKVMIRLNLELYNADDLLMLVDELAERFSGRKDVCVYVRSLFEFAGAVSVPRSESDRALIYEKQCTLEQRIAQHGLQLNVRMPSKPSLNRCMADNDKTVTISPNGDLGKCEHINENEFHGHISSTEQNTCMLNSWKERCDEEEACLTCFNYPACVRLKKCKESTHCFREDRLSIDSSIRKIMLKTYQNFKSGIKDDTEDIIPEEC